MRRLHACDWLLAALSARAEVKCLVFGKK